MWTRGFLAERPRKVFMNIKCAVIAALLLLISIPAHAKTYWKRGMWIGAASGAVVGGLSLGLVAGSKSRPAGSDSDFTGFYGTSGGAVGGFAGAVIGAAAGVGIGALVGSLIR